LYFTDYGSGGWSSNLSGRARLSTVFPRLP
jgi:hypothetical protein